MKKTVVRIATAALLAAGTMTAVPSAQAATLNCTQRVLPNGWYNLCSGVERPRQYQTQVTCHREWHLNQRYIVQGAWRYYGTGNPSIATCNTGDFPTGDRQLNFR